jgi:uncharacterized surface protein with fasciclin (FAS1) repeats
MTICLQRFAMLWVIALGAMASACGGGGGDDSSAAPSQSAGQWARSNGHRTLMAAADKAGLSAQIDTPAAALTLLAPTDAAFDALAQRLGLANGDALVASMDPEVLAGLLRFHLLPTTKSSSALAAGGARQATTYQLDGQPATVGLSSSGGLHLTDAMGAASRITAADVAVTNGLAHVIDKVMVPPGLLGIAQMVRSDPSLASFAQAIAAAGMQALLDSDATPFTVLAPSGDVSAAVQAATGRSTSDVITAVVAHHVLWAPMQLAEMLEAGTVATADQQTLGLEAGPPPAVVDATGVPSHFILTDIRARNGVIHRVDKVLIPAF